MQFFFFFFFKSLLKQHCIHLWCRSLYHPHHFHRIQLLWILTFDSDRTCYFTFRYAIMMDCWETEPENRPSFDSLCNKIKRLEMGANQVRNPSVWFSDLFNRYKVIFFHWSFLHKRFSDSITRWCLTNLQLLGKKKK